MVIIKVYSTDPWWFLDQVKSNSPVGHSCMCTHLHLDFMNKIDNMIKIDWTHNQFNIIYLICNHFSQYCFHFHGDVFFMYSHDHDDHYYHHKLKLDIMLTFTAKKLNLKPFFSWFQYETFSFYHHHYYY